MRSGAMTSGGGAGPRGRRRSASHGSHTTHTLHHCACCAHSCHRGCLYCACCALCSLDGDVRVVCGVWYRCLWSSAVGKATCISPCGRLPPPSRCAPSAASLRVGGRRSASRRKRGRCGLRRCSVRPCRGGARRDGAACMDMSLYVQRVCASACVVIFFLRHPPGQRTDAHEPTRQRHHIGQRRGHRARVPRRQRLRGGRAITGRDISAVSAIGGGRVGPDGVRIPICTVCGLFVC